MKGNMTMIKDHSFPLATKFSAQLQNLPVSGKICVSA